MTNTYLIMTNIVLSVAFVLTMLNLWRKGNKISDLEYIVESQDNELDSIKTEIRKLKDNDPTVVFSDKLDKLIEVTDKDNLLGRIELLEIQLQVAEEEKDALHEAIKQKDTQIHDTNVYLGYTLETVEAMQKEVEDVKAKAEADVSTANMQRDMALNRVRVLRDANEVVTDKVRDISAANSTMIETMEAWLTILRDDHAPMIDGLREILSSAHKETFVRQPLASMPEAAGRPDAQKKLDELQDKLRNN